MDFALENGWDGHGQTHLKCEQEHEQGCKEEVPPENPSQQPLLQFLEQLLQHALLLSFE